MPIYAFRCAACDHAFDKLQKLSDPDPEICPDCKTEGNVKRQLTAPSFRLAGSGWYETDFKKGDDRKRNLVEGGEGAGKPETASSSGAGQTDGGDKPKPTDKKTDTPAAKPESKPEAKPVAKPAAGDAK